MASSFPASTIILNPPTVRRTANFHPSIWGDAFISYKSDEATLTRWREKAHILRGKVQDMLSADDTTRTRLSLIDAIQRLGIAYHFEEEIEQELAHEFARLHDDSCEEDLSAVSLRFRLLREHGYNIKCEVFMKFMDDKGNFKESIKEDVNGILSLYEAAHLKIHGEEILDLALSFTTACLRSMLPHLNPVYTQRVLHALSHPIRRRLDRLYATGYFSVYKEMEQSNEELLEFAKIDFNIVQKLHQKELSTLSKWWKELDFGTKLPFARDRLVECYFWIIGVYFEPKYALARRFLTQIIAMTSVADDIYDAYGTNEELCVFTKAIERLDESSMINLPEYMKIWYQALLDVYHNMEEKMSQQGNSTYGLPYTKEAMKGVAKAYYKERKWLEIEEIPTFEEYMDVALVTSAYPMLAVSSLLGMVDEADEETFKWLNKMPKILYASATICRLMDDITGHKFERERGNAVTAVECFAREQKVSEDVARDTLKMNVERAWEDVNQGFVRPTPVARALLMRILNLCRVIDLLYNDTDGYTHVNPTVKEYVVSMLINEAQL